MGIRRLAGQPYLPYHLVVMTRDDTNEGTSMQFEAAEILRHALQLPPEARAVLVGSLIESLDEEVDADAEEAWAREITRRMREIDSGEVKPVPWSEVRRRLQAG